MSVGRRLGVFLVSSTLLTACVSLSPAASPADSTTTPTGAPATTQAAPPTATATAPATPTAPAAATPATPTHPPHASVIPTSGIPTSQPTSDSGTAGDRLQLGDYQYVTMAEAEWSESGYQDFFEPTEGNVLYAFLMEFEGIDPEGSSYNPLYFDLTVNGADYNYYLFGKEPTLGSGDLTPGATANGWLTFEAPLAATVLLRYEPVMGLTGESAEWTVTVNQ
jgi:hypothetical protein